jgi:hypothetical protein
MEARKKVAAGIDPSRERQEAREAAVQAMTFGEVAEEWLERQKHVLAPVTFEKATWMLKTLVCPWLGKRPIAEIEPPELLTVLRRIEVRGKHETADRTKQRCGQVFRYAIATGRAHRDPSADLRDALTPVRSEHRAAVTDPAQVGKLLNAIDAFDGTFVVRSALQLAPLVFVRPGELRRMRKLPHTAAEDLLEVIMRRYERASTLLTSNPPVDDWGKLLGDTAAVTGLLDRLLHHAHVLKCGPRSWRTKVHADLRPDPLPQ